jgi:hypothetical protein
MASHIDMAFRIRYRCSDEKCGYAVGLATLFPTWKEDTPPSLAKVPVGVINQPYVASYYDERVCLACRKTVQVEQDETKCPECAVEGQFMEVGVVCPRCDIGKIVEERDRRVCF